MRNLKATLADQKEMAGVSAKAKADLNKDKLPRTYCGRMGEKSNSSFSAETLVYT